jgi:hypothetical protein
MSLKQVTQNAKSDRLTVGKPWPSPIEQLEQAISTSDSKIQIETFQLFAAPRNSGICQLGKQKNRFVENNPPADPLHHRPHHWHASFRGELSHTSIF